MSVPLQRWVFTVDEYDRMTDAGILSKEDRVELIEGDLIRMSPIGKTHASRVDRLTEVLVQRVVKYAIVRVQNPVQLDAYSKPQPDIVLLRRRDDFYSREVPTPDDVLLIIEVADSTIEYDKKVKVPLYARAGIPEVWLEDLLKDRIEAYSEPVNGTYQKCRIVEKGQSIPPEKLPMFVFTIDELLG